MVLPGEATLESASPSASRNGPAFSRGRGPRGGRRGRAGRGIAASSYSRRAIDTPANPDPEEPPHLPRAIVSRPDPQDQSKRPIEVSGEQLEADVCFICASNVAHQCLTPCNHRTCHICGLRMRALYKNRDCAHCRVRLLCWKYRATH